MKRPGPLLQMSFALVVLCGMLVLLADLFFGVLADPVEQTMRLRRNLGEALAVQVAALLQSDDRAALRRTLDEVAARTDGVRSLALLRADGSVVMQAGDRDYRPRIDADDASNPQRIVVTLNAGGARWGTFEIVFVSPPGNALMRWISEPAVLLLIFMSTAGTLAFGLYMRRALAHLDPSAVVPERVQGAFDTLAEGVVVLDAGGRVMLTNKAFRTLHPDAAAVAIGARLSALGWLGANLSADVDKHPWALAISQKTASAGDTLEIGGGNDGNAAGAAQARQLVINCAPITDAGGKVRGCIATFNDVSELHRANAAQRDALAALTAATEEVQRQNTQLAELATRDPLTGCLNRRAFYELFETALRETRTSGAALSCVMLDIDHFKNVNDTHGHAVGDRVIQEVAKKLVDSARATDLVCRYGGEEFCVVLPGLGAAGAIDFAERLRQRIEAECGPGVRETPGLRVTVSVGVDVMSRESATAPALIDRADQALYRAKRSGRNRVCSSAADAIETAQVIAAAAAARPLSGIEAVAP